MATAAALTVPSQVARARCGSARSSMPGRRAAATVAVTALTPMSDRLIAVATLIRDRDADRP